MKPILDIYKQYKIMPQLAEHQLRVAAAASLICDGITGGAESKEIERDNIIKACLLHDMGNIVKFTFDQTTRDMVGPEELNNLVYWEKVKEEFVQKYGRRSHDVTNNILRELKLSRRILELVDSVGFSQAQDNAGSVDFGKKICSYADMRVGPFGVISLEARFVDLRERYKNHPEGEKTREVFEAALREIEKQIFARSAIRPSDIDQSYVNKRIVELRSCQI